MKLETETLDKLYLEWSQFTSARTFRELQLSRALKDALDMIVWMSGSDDFSPDGKAAVGWKKNKPILDRLLKISKEQGNGRLFNAAI